MNTNIVPFETALQTFVQAAQGMIDAYMEKHFPMLPKAVLTVEPGRRYARIVKTAGPSRHVYCFVDMTNGDILKSESWKKPAKHARGSIYAKNPTEAVTEYGANYLR